jgi:splicing factor 45
MSKYGWSKGTGLGADGSGIVNPLRVQVEKRRKKPDSEGGGFADPKGIGKIIGGKKNSAGKDSEHGKFGAMSEVIVLRGMVDGMDLDEEVGDGGLMQEIGDECSEKVGDAYIILLIHGLQFPSMVVLNVCTLNDVAMLLQRYLSNSQASYQP